MRLAYDVAPKIGNTLSRQTFDGDARYYQRLATSGVLALRFRGFKSIGRSPTTSTSAATPKCAATTTCSSSARTSSSPTPSCASRSSKPRSRRFGVIGGVRGVFFANMGGGWFNDQGFKFATSEHRRRQDHRRLSARRRLGQTHLRPGHQPADSDLRRQQDRERLPPEGRPRVVRPRPRDLRARIPDSLRLVVAHDLQQGLGRRRCSPATAAARSSASRASRCGSATTSKHWRRPHLARTDAEPRPMPAPEPILRSRALQSQP